MSIVAWKILAEFIRHFEQNNLNYMPTWTLSKMLGTTETIEASSVKHCPTNEYEAGLKELVDLGLIAEIPDLGERFKLVVKVQGNV